MKKKRFYLLLLLIVAVVPLLDLLPVGLPITHDGQDHVARIANFAQSLSEGNPIPRWAKNLNWGYGHPILMFLYPLPSYLGSLFHFLGFSLVASVKLVFGLSLFLSGLFMYQWIKQMWGEKAGLVAGVVYMLAPYRLVDLYVRGAIGECWAFVWPPLICWFGLKLSQQRRWAYLAGGSLSLALMILSHNALSLMFLSLIGIYFGCLVLWQKKKQSLIIDYVLMVGFGFILSAFFWFPAFFEGKYTLRDIVTAGNITGFESFSRLLWSSWSYGITGQLSVQLGIIQWLLILAGPLVIWRLKTKKEKNWLFLLGAYLLFWLGIFLILPVARPLYLQVSLLQKFQFAWRFLSLAVLIPPIIAGALIILIPERTRSLVMGLMVLAALFLSKDYWHAKDYLIKPESYFSGVYESTTDTGESAPIWSIRFMEKFPDSPMAVIDGEADIELLKRQVNRHTYQVMVSKQSRLVENTLYFPGWKVLVDGQPVVIEFQDPSWRGLMTFNVSEGEHLVEVIFGETKLRQFANLISLGGLFGLGLFGKILKRSRKQKTK